MSSVIWVTSFSPELYRATGQKMIQSFLDTQTEGFLQVFPERVTEVARVDGRLRVWKDLTDDPYLRCFLLNNSDIIPVHLGGRWTGPCACPHPDDVHARDHRPGCPGAWFNRHASRWFRKVLALYRVFETFHTMAPVVWLDSDVRFERRVSAKLAESWFKGRDLFYLQGPRRKEAEVGVAGYQHLGGLRFVRAFLERYVDGAYRADRRWDDSYQHRMVRKVCEGVSFVDLATGTSGHGDVVPHSPLAPYLTHDKGIHGRILGIHT